jgi:hypothetical protein
MWTEGYKEDFHNLYALPNITRVIKSRMMRRVGHCIFEEMKNVYKM